MTPLVRSLLLSGLAVGGLLGGRMAREPAQQRATPWRLVQELTACFCPSNHAQTVIASSAQLDSMSDSAPCTSRGDGAEERARAWGERCRRAVADAALDLDTHALVYVARFYSSGMIRGSLEVSGPESGTLTLEMRRHQPDGPLTPDLALFAWALVVDKALVREARVVDPTGAAIVLPVTDAEAEVKAEAGTEP
jgi:hypothetical protein